MGLYQQVLDEIFASIIVEDYRPEIPLKMRIEYHEQIDEIANRWNEKYPKDILAVYVQVLMGQFLLADLLFREVEKSNWVERCLKRSSVDIMPDGYTVYKTFFGTDAD